MLLRVVDIFSGAGGLALGFRAAGCEIAAAVDVDAVAGETIRRNFERLQPGLSLHVLAGDEYDLGSVDLNTLCDQPPDILTGGPPCQGYSRLGRGKLDSLTDEGFEGDPRNQLYRRFLDAVREWQPRAVVMENVPGMLSVRGMNYAAIFTNELAAEGYRVGYIHLNAVWYGVPQFRERLFFVGYREDLGVRPKAPPATHWTSLPEGYRRPVREHAQYLPFGPEWERIEGELAVRFVSDPLPAVTVREALDDLPAIHDHPNVNSVRRGDSRRAVAYRPGPVSSYASLMRSWPGLPSSEGVFDHIVRRTPRDYETFRRMQHGDRYPQAILIARERFEQELRRLESEGRAPAPSSEARRELESRFVPPYPIDSFEDRWRKLIPDQPSWTVPAHLARDSYSHIHHDSAQARMMSVREAARLQSFPDSFLFAGNMGDCFRQIGNAVPPLLAWAIAFEVLGKLGYEGNAPPAAEQSSGYCT
jgi:DNA (cytosine-5)-methyltransferase 1